MAKFYACVKTAWQSDEWVPVDGPFASKSEASQAGEEFVASVNEDRRVIDASPMSRTGLYGMGYRCDDELAEHVDAEQTQRFWRDEEAEKAGEYRALGIF